VENRALQPETGSGGAHSPVSCMHGPSKGAQKEPKRSPKGAQKEPKRDPKGAQKEPEVAKLMTGTEVSLNCAAA